MQKIAYFPWSIVSLYDLESLAFKLKRSYIVHKSEIKETYILKIKGISYETDLVTDLRIKLREVESPKKINVRLKDLFFIIDGGNWNITFDGKTDKRKVKFDADDVSGSLAEQKLKSFLSFWEKNIKKRTRSKKFRNFMYIGILEYFDILVLLMGIFGSIASYFIIPHAYSSHGLKFPALILVGETGVPSLLAVLVSATIILTDGKLEPYPMMSRVKNGKTTVKNFLISNYSNYYRIVFLFFAYSIFYNHQIMGDVSALPDYYISTSIYLTINELVKDFLAPLIAIRIFLSIVKDNWVSRIKIRQEKVKPKSPYDFSY